MRFKILTCALSIVGTAAIAGEPAKEAFEARTVSDIVSLCSASEDSDTGKYAIGFCYGWLRGIDEFYDALLADERFNVKAVACPGRDVSPGETRQLFVDWASSTTGAMEMAALPGLIRAAKEIFPCP